MSDYLAFQLAFENAFRFKRIVVLNMARLYMQGL